MPESALHDQIVRLLVEILLAWQSRSKTNAMVGRNIATHWHATSPRLGVAPDAYVVEPPPPQGIGVTSLCTWKPGHHAPRIAVEVVSESTAAKDYGDGPDRYAASGTKELWIFDPLGPWPSWSGFARSSPPRVAAAVRHDGRLPRVTGYGITDPSADPLPPQHGQE